MWMIVGGDNPSPKTLGVLKERRMSKLLFNIARRIKDERTINNERTIKDKRTLES
jgi:hypothetical protein